MSDETKKGAPPAEGVEHAEKTSAADKDTAASSSASDAIKSELEKTKLSVQEQIAEMKKREKEKEEENKLLKKQIADINANFEQLKKKNMTKEELEADERKRLQQQVNESEKLIDKLQKEIRAKEVDIRRKSIALETGVPLEMMEFITGEDEEDIKAKCAKLASYAKKAATPSVVTENRVTEVGSEKTSGSLSNTDSLSQDKRPGANKGLSFQGMKAKVQTDPNVNRAFKDVFGIKDRK